MIGILTTLMEGRFEPKFNCYFGLLAQGVVTNLTLLHYGCNFTTTADTTLLQEHAM